MSELTDDATIERQENLQNPPGESIPKVRLDNCVQYVASEDDRGKWLEARLRFITSSDLAVFMGLEPKWWSFSSRASIIETKAGADNYRPNHNTEHGIANEECNRVKAERLLGMSLPPCKALYTNPRWPYIGATPDAYALPGPLRPPQKLLTSHPYLIEPVRAQVQEQSDVGGCQLKSTDSINAVHYGKRGKGSDQDWITHVPDYHLPQVQTEMYVMGWDWTLLVGQLGAHNMVAWFVPRDPEWGATMDAANADAKVVLDTIRDAA